MGSQQRPPLELFQQTLKRPEFIRNVCILAHVDHGKTTIADSLLATNRLVSRRMAGYARYLDDRPDEQERGITMKSSTVSLLNLIKPLDGGPEVPLLLNLIDTPGHIDFNSEVGSALRVSDGAVIVVDLVEGVCVQTRESIRQAFAEQCVMILLLNKVDKLIVELSKSASEIFEAILHAIEDCNAIIAELYHYEFNQTVSDIEIEDSGLLFNPECGNVIFASAIDGWGFTLPQLSKIFLKINRGAIKDETSDTLTSKMWDFDKYFCSKSGLIKSGAIEKNRQNLFTQLFVKTLHHVYTTIVIQMRKDQVVGMCSKLHVEVTRDMSHNDPKVQIRAVMQAWSSLADVILTQCHVIVPPPTTMPEKKIKYLLDYDRLSESLQHDSPLRAYLDDVLEDCGKCRNDSCHLVGYVPKMFCVDNRNLSQNRPRVFVPGPRNPVSVPQETPEEPKREPERDFSIVALARYSPKKGLVVWGREGCRDTENTSEITILLHTPRVFSGTLRTGQRVHVKTAQSLSRSVTVKELYMLFGRELVLVDELGAGNVCGIAGLEDSIVRTATFASYEEAPETLIVPFIEHSSLPPIVRNSIEPLNPKDLPILRQGLRTLMQSDSCVQVLIQETGELVLMTAGDVHLAKCLEDLRKFAPIEVNVSSPMVSLRETIVSKGDTSIVVEVAQVRLALCVVPLSQRVAMEIERYHKLLRDVEDHQMVAGFELTSKRANGVTPNPSELKRFKSEALNSQMALVMTVIGDLEDRVSPDNLWSVGRQGDSVNLLVNATSDYRRNIFHTLDEGDARAPFDHFVVNSFNAFCKSGPICEEPLKNCLFLVKTFDLIGDVATSTTTRHNVNVESCLTGGFRGAFTTQSPRLMEPVFTTTIQVTTSILGKVYSVVNRRHGKVLDAVGMDEQEKSFLVKAQIPVVESTGFANEIRKTTSGQAMPTLKFSHFETIEGDPYFVEEEEAEEEDSAYLEMSVRANKLRREIRRRKGLQVDEQVVVHAEKQRTLNKKK